MIDGPGEHCMEAELHVDEGCTVELLLSEYKAQQLGLRREPDAKSVFLADDRVTKVHRYVDCIGQRIRQRWTQGSSRANMRIHQG